MPIQHRSDFRYKCVVKKEDKKDREVRGGVALSTGVYIKRYMRSGLAQDVLTSAVGDCRGRF